MPDAETTKSPDPIKVMVPAYGVRAQCAHGMVYVAASDDPGTGSPWKAAFLPVLKVNDRLALFDHAKGAAIDTPVLADFDRLARKRPIASFEGWHHFQIAANKWPLSPHGVLVLLFYFQTEGIGRNEPHPWDNPPSSDQEEQDPNWQQAFLQVAARLKSDPVRVLSSAVLSMALPCVASNQPRSPSPSLGPITFALASCQYPGDLLDRSPRFSQTSGDGPADASLMRLAARLDTPDDALRPRFLLLAGDQIYADATAGMFDPTVRDDIYRNSYQGFFGSRGALSVFNRLPVFMMLDDHEIADNWEPEPQNQQLLVEGRAAYWKHQRDAGPLRSVPKDDSVLWVCIEPEGLPIFMADTRTRREARSAPSFQTANIVDEPQFKHLTDWLLARKDAARPSFVVSPSMLLPRPLGLAARPASAVHCDAWAGYPRSLHHLLAFLSDHEIGNAVFLSGDEHLSCVAQVSVARKTGGSKIELR